MSGTVEYLIAIRAQIQAGIDQAFKNIGAAAAGMTGQVNKAEAALGRLQKAEMAQAAAMAAAERQRKIAVAESNRWYAAGAKSAAAEEKALARQIAMQNKAAAASQAASARRNSFWGGSHHGGGEGVMGNLMTAGIVGYMGVHMVKGMGHFLDHANEQMMARQRMAMVGFKGEIMSEADKVATELTGKYKNISKAGVLEQMYEGVAIHGDAQHALENVEAQVRLASFLQSWDGGKHAGKSKDWNREVFAAIKSMEMMGVLNEHDPEKKKADINNYLGAMMSMKTLYGDQAKLSEYLTAQKRAGASFYRLGEDFRFGILPAMIQERGGSMVGQQLMTGFQTIVGGTKLRKSQIAAMKGYGIYDDKTGRFKQQFVDSYLHNPFETAQMLAGEIAKKHGLDPAKAGDLEKLKDFMSKDMSWLFPNRNAAGVFMDMNMNNKNFLKHAEALKAVRQEMDAIAKGEFFAAKTWGGAKASAAKQFDNLLAALGGPMLPPAIAGINKLAGTFHDWTSGLDTFFSAHPDIASKVGSVATYGSGLLAGAAGLAAVGFAVKALGSGLGALGFGKLLSGVMKLGMFAGGLGAKLAKAVLWGGRLGGIAGPVAAAAGASRLSRALMLASLWGTKLMRLTGIGVGLAIGATVWQNWDKLAAAMDRVWSAKNKIKQIGKEYDNLGDWFRGTKVGKWVDDKLGINDHLRKQAIIRKGDPYRRASALVARSQEMRRQYAPPPEMYTDPMGNSVPSSAPRSAGANVAAAQAQRVQVETHFDALQISPGSLTVTYNGPLQGPGSVPVNGSGGHPRGEALPAATSTGQ